MIVSHLIKPLYSVYLQCRSSAQLLCTVCLILVLATSGGSTGYAVYATAYPAIEPCVLRLARLERPSLARVDSPACLTVTYDSIEETYRFQGQPTNEYSLFFLRKTNTPYWKDSWSTDYCCGGVIFVYCSEIDQHQYHVSTSYIPIVLHAIFQLCTTSIRCSFYIKKYHVASHDTIS
jgi:hypothetical protein